MQEKNEQNQTPKIAFYLNKCVSGFEGGAHRSLLDRAKIFIERGYNVDLVVQKGKGPSADKIPQGARVVEIQASSKINTIYFALKAMSIRGKKIALPVVLHPKGVQKLDHLPDLVKYLRSESIQVLISKNLFFNLTAIWARRLSQVSTKVIIELADNLSSRISGKQHKGIHWRFLVPLLGYTYAQSDGIVAVSEGVAQDFASTAKFSRINITRIYNPIIVPDFKISFAKNSPHSWLNESSEIPVIIGCGRLDPQKNFKMLLRAFASLRRQREVRMLILGEGPERKVLETLKKELDINEDVELPGFVSNPYTAFAHASLFALSSNHEGLPRVLIEALACGCPVVSTDCSSGPKEILDNGHYGELVPVDDHESLAKAMARTLDAPPDNKKLRARAAEFDGQLSTDQYLELLFPGNVNLKSKIS